MTSSEIADKLELPFLADLFSDVNDKYTVLKELTPNDLPYDSKSSLINILDLHLGHHSN